MDAVGTVSAVLELFPIIYRVQQSLRRVKDFDGAFKDRKHLLPQERELLDAVDAIQYLIANIQRFCIDYKDRAVAQKVAAFQELLENIERFFAALQDADKLIRWARGARRADMIDTYARIARELHQNLRHWVRDVIDSPIQIFVEREIDPNTLEFREFTWNIVASRDKAANRLDRLLPTSVEFDQRLIRGVDEIEFWIFYKLYQRWVSTNREISPDSIRIARTSILFWDFEDKEVMPKLFKSAVSKTVFREITEIFRRPACSAKIWRQDYTPGNEEIPLTVGLLMLKAMLARSKRRSNDRLTQTSRLRAQSRERRPYPSNLELRQHFELGTTTFIIYHAPIALSRNEENWSLFGAVCHESQRSVGVISSNAYFSAKPDELKQMTSGEYVSEGSVEMGPFGLVLQMISLLTDKDAAEVTRHAANIYDIERKLRLFIPDDLHRSASGIELDFQLATTTLSSAISGLNFHQMRLDGNLTVLRTLCTQVPANYVTKQHKERDDFLRTAEALQISIENWLTDIRFNLKIASTQLQVAYTMVSQRDARDSVRLTEASMKIAEAAKSDSSVMKMLAVLGAVFLPGTYISALFSMNMFNWQAEPGGQVVSPYFWIYWAIMAPVTATVATLVTLFVLAKTPGSFVSVWLQRDKSRTRIVKEPSLQQQLASISGALSKSGAARKSLDEEKGGMEANGPGGSDRHSGSDGSLRRRGGQSASEADVSSSTHAVEGQRRETFG